MESYDLLELPKGYKADSLLVIAPYFDAPFFERVLTSLKPRVIRIVFDDGANGDDLERIRKACGKYSTTIALGKAAGIVHLKGYVLDFVKSNGRKQRFKRFIFGSANASHAAFGGARNAELVAATNLSSSNDWALIDYFDAISRAIDEGRGSINPVQTDQLRYSATLRLPAFSVVAPGPAPGFDAWLQRGQLVAKYKDSQQFMATSIRLRESLPAGAVEQLFIDQGLAIQGERNIVRHRYVADKETHAKDNNSEPQWRSQYCVWTHFGDWVSEDCFKSRRHLMVAKAGADRRRRIDELITHGRDSKWKNAKGQAFLAVLKNTWRALERAGRKPFEYLEGAKAGIDEPHYRRLLEEKIKADLAQAEDKKFYARYTDGYEFSDVPKFRQDEAAWQDFVRSWCETITIEANRKGSRSLVMKRVRAAIKPKMLAHLDIERVTESIYSLWWQNSSESKVIGDRVWALFDDGEYYLGRISALSKAGAFYSIRFNNGDKANVHKKHLRSAGEFVAGYFQIGDGYLRP